MKVRTIVEVVTDTGEVLPVGMINDRPDSHFWIGLGLAEPADAEAEEKGKYYESLRERARKTLEQQAQRQFEQHRADEAQRVAEFEATLREGV